MDREDMETMEIEATGPNADQIEFWNGEAGQSWARNQEVLDRMMAPLDELVIRRAEITSSDRVLDVGCGCGASSMAIANRGARVTGIDVSGPMLAVAQNKTLQDPQVEFLLADALTHKFRSGYSLLFSRFGVMFFADPVAAFSNLAGSLTADGRLCFICWRNVLENEWITVPMMAALPFLPEMEPSPPGAPGPFAFAEKDHIQDILENAGFTDIEITPENQRLNVSSDNDINKAIDFYENLGPLAKPLSSLDGSKKEQALESVKTAIEPFFVGDGLTLDSAVWIVKARR
jgi:SAM-dependent methyltransferase